MNAAQGLPNGVATAAAERAQHRVYRGVIIRFGTLARQEGVSVRVPTLYMHWGQGAVSAASGVGGVSAADKLSDQPIWRTWTTNENLANWEDRTFVAPKYNQNIPVQDLRRESRRCVGVYV